MPFLFMWTWMLICFWQPVLTVFLEMIGISFGEGLLIPAFVSISMSLFLFYLAFRRFGFPYYLVFFYPIIILLSYTAALRSMFNAIFGKSVWKGRLVLRPNIVFLDLDSGYSLAEDPVIGGMKYDKKKIDKIILPDDPGHGADIRDDFLDKMKILTI